MSLFQRIFSIFSNAYTSFYWGMFWPCFKFIHRKFTSLHELQRKALAQDLTGFHMSIKRSKQLPTIKQYFEHEIYTQEALDMNIIQEIYNNKLVSQSKKNDEIFLRMFSRLFAVIKSKQYLEEVRKTAFDHKDNEHKQTLVKLWKLLRNDEPLSDMITKQWIDIGFQGEDPATDFRGAGYLGLENLIYFIEMYPENALHAYKESRNPKHNYFFAAAGLYLTLEIYFMMNDNYFEELFYQANTKDKAKIVFGEIYSAMFHMFDKFWIKQENATMMTFNTIILEFFSLIRQELFLEFRRTIQEGCRARRLL